MQEKMEDCVETLEVLMVDAIGKVREYPSVHECLRRLKFETGDVSDRLSGLLNEHPHLNRRISKLNDEWTRLSEWLENLVATGDVQVDHIREWLRYFRQFRFKEYAVILDSVNLCIGGES